MVQQGAQGPYHSTRTKNEEHNTSARKNRDEIRHLPAPPPAPALRAIMGKKQEALHGKIQEDFC
jgi:hypothetical protein